ncbi:MAG: ATP-dependent helicase, partial [Candidatus Nanoarchaeia archaeon]
RLNRGDIFLLGGETYEFRFSRGMVAQVIPTPQRPPTVPSWYSEMLPLSFDLACDIQRFRKLMNQKFAHDYSKKEIMRFILDYLYVDENAAEAIYNFCKEQYDYIGLPHSDKIIVEHYSDEKDSVTTVFHTLFGRRVNDVLSRAVAFAISRSQHRDVEIGVTDNGFYVKCDKKVQVVPALKLIKSSELRRILNLALDRSEVLKRRFRHCATRALMILREYKGRKKRVGKQQVSSMLLMNAVKRISPDFFILKEARREVLEDLMDINNAIKILELIEQGKIKVVEVNTKIPSPFAFGLVLEGATDIMKIDDKQEFLRRMHQLVLAKIAVEKGKKDKSS